MVLRSNVSSTYNVFSAATKAGATRVVFSSSAFASGFSHDPNGMVPHYLPLDEAHPPLPHETYGLSKVMGEHTASLFARLSRGATSFVSLRFTVTHAPSPLSHPRLTQASLSTMTL